jgi:regulator of CtrA degradation
MVAADNIDPRIIEALYCEGLELADEVRAAFGPGNWKGGSPEDHSHVARSCEALRTTTRMMHSIAWLLNHRAYLKGELNERQLRRQSRLSTDFPQSDPSRVALLNPELRALITATECFHDRLVRLDTQWREHETGGPSGIQTLRDRLRKALS